MASLRGRATSFLLNLQKPQVLNTKFPLPQLCYGLRLFCSHPATSKNRMSYCLVSKMLFWFFTPVGFDLDLDFQMTDTFLLYF